MFAWLTGMTVTNGSLVLIPDVSGRKYAGFHSGNSLTLTANPGETVGQVMDKFNAFRGPEQQITVLFTYEGQPIPFLTIIRGSMDAYVRYTA